MPALKLLLVSQRSILVMLALCDGLLCFPLRADAGDESDRRPADSRGAVALSARDRPAADAIVALHQGLPAANGESEIFRRQARELSIRMAALGIDGVTGDASGLEQRLLRAVRNIQLLQAERAGLKQALTQLSEAILRFQKSALSTDGESRSALEVEMRSATRLLSADRLKGRNHVASHTPLTSGSVISVENDLALVVTNLGASSGVKVGMPFQILREDEIIGSLRVVDVRDEIAGAVIQNTAGGRGRIRIGDCLRLDTQE